MDSTLESINDNVNIGFLMLCSVLIFLFVIGVGLFNASLGARKNCLTNFSLCVVCFVVGIAEYVLIGHTMLQSTNGNLITNNMNTFFFTEMTAETSAGLGQALINKYLVKSITEFFATALTLSVLCGAFMERARPSAAVIFMFLWTVLIYNIVVYWASSPHSFINKLGVINAAAGGPNVCIGVASLVYSWYLGPRKEPSHSPHSGVLVVFSTVLIWLGWLGVGGTLSGSLDSRALISIINYTFAGVFGGMAWFLKSAVIDRKRFDIIAFCFGAIGAFIVVSPSVSSIDFYSSMIIGVVGAFVCNYSVLITKYLKVDDTINLFAFQGVGSFSGLLLAGIFTRKNLYNLNDEYKILGGWVSGNWMQICNQLLFGIVSFVWSLLLSFLIILFIERICKIKIRVSSDEELKGLDVSFIGISSYGHKDKPLQSCLEQEKISVI